MQHRERYEQKTIRCRAEHESTDSWKIVPSCVLKLRMLGLKPYMAQGTVPSNPASSNHAQQTAHDTIPSAGLV